MVAREVAVAGLMSVAFTLTALAQGVSLPKELSGRWSFSGGANTFSLNEIAASGDTGFTAKLTWWTMDPKCAIKNEPIAGKVTETGLKFDAATKCGIAFSAELNQSEKQWAGKATTAGGTVVNMKAE